MSQRHPLHAAWVRDQAAGLGHAAEHRWRLVHTAECGLQHTTEVSAPTNAQACAWAEQLYGPALALACIRLTPAAPRH